MNKVTIIVPVYNVAKYLPHCAQSLVKQNYPKLEILLVNDGSTDESAKLCNSLAASDKRIRVIHKENGGLSDARNAGLDKAKGDWILFVDGDDYLAPDAVSLLMEQAQPDVDFVQFLYHETEDTHWLPDPEQKAQPEICTDNSRMWHKLYELGGVAASSCTKLWNKRIFETARFLKGILHEDEELLNRVLSDCTKVVYTQLELYGYVMRQGSIVRSVVKPKQLDIFTVMEQRVEVLQKLGYEDLVTETRSRMFLNALLLFLKAKGSKMKELEKELKQLLLSFSKYPDLNLQGQYRLVYRCTRIFPWTPELYYFIRKICGKTI